MKQLSAFHIFPVKIVNQNWKQLNSQMVACISSYSVQRNICKGCTVTSTPWGQITAIVIVCSNTQKSLRVVSKSGNHSFTVYQSVIALILHTTNHSNFSHIMFTAPLHAAACHIQWKAFTADILVHSTFVSRSNNPLLATDNNVLGRKLYTEPQTHYGHSIHIFSSKTVQKFVYKHWHIYRINSSQCRNELKLHTTIEQSY